MRISYYLSLPLLLVLLVATGTWYFSYLETGDLRQLEKESHIHVNNVTSFNRVSNGFSSLLILADLIVGSDQTFLVESYLNQSNMLIDRLGEFRRSEDWCCEKEALLDFQQRLLSIEKSIVRSALSYTGINEESRSTLLAALDVAAKESLQDIRVISSSLLKFSQENIDLLDVGVSHYRDVLFLTWALGVGSIFLVWLHITRTIAAPIIGLSKSAEEALEDGEFSAVDGRAPAEILALSRSLERLTNHLESEISSEREKIKSAERASSAKLWELAHIDPLTKIANRSLFNQHFSMLLADHGYDQEPFSVCILDVNEFKLVNDTLGHISGDKLLIELGQILNSFLNKESLVCRLGGDEFGLLIKPGIKASEDNDFFGGIVAECEKMSFSSEARSGAHISIGVASFPEHGTDMKSLLLAADTAMFEAKQDRVNESSWMRFHQGMDAGRLRVARIKEEIERALEEKEFCLYFQPIVDVKTDKILSAEALLRWPAGPKDVFVPEIISVAEKSGLILALGNVIIDEAFQVISVLEEKSIPLTIAINISAIQFQYQDLTQIIKAKAEEYNFRPDRLVVEITESTFIDNIERTKGILSDLKSIGVGVAIDDFGTGYSSLSYLQKLAVNWVKIDKEFISGAEADLDNPALLEAIISMGHAMGAGLVAEGVEDEAQLSLLESLGCDRIQGYVFSKPLPTNEFFECIESGTAS